MKKKIAKKLRLIRLSCLILLLMTSTSYAQPPEIHIEHASFPIFNNDTFDFGNFFTGANSGYIQFDILNQGVNPLNLGPAAWSKSGPNAGNFTVDSTGMTYPIPGSLSTSFFIRYVAGLGTETAFILIPNGDSDENPYRINLKGTGIAPPDIDVKLGVTSIPSTGSHYFGAGPIGVPSGPITFTIDNLGPNDLTLSGSPATAVSVSGGNSADFYVDVTSTSTTISTSTTFTIEFTPSGAGPSATTLYIYTDDPDESMYTIDLSGDGIPASGPEIDINQGGTYISSGGNYDFGPVPITSTAGPFTFFIENNGTADLNITPGGGGMVDISGPDAADFTVNATAIPGTINNGNFAPFTISYTPSSTSPASATITIISDDVDENPFTFSLTGSGFYAPPSISPNTFYVNVNDPNSTIVGNVNAIPGSAPIVSYNMSGCSLVAGTCTPYVEFNVDAGGNIIVNDNSSFGIGQEYNLNISCSDTNSMSSPGQMQTIYIVGTIPQDPLFYFSTVPSQIKFGDQPFKLTAKSHSDPQSTGDITYSVLTAGPASIDSTTGMVTIYAAGTVLFRADIAATATHSAAYVTISLDIDQIPASLTFNKQGNELLGGAFPLITSTHPAYDGTLSYSIVAGEFDTSGAPVITLDPVNGIVTPLLLGKVIIKVSASGTTNFMAEEVINEVTIYPKKLTPVAVKNTLRIDIGDTGIVDIDSNDYGRTAALTNIIDLDQIHPGVQSYYSKAGVGDFSVDTMGVLTYIPAPGFSSEGEIEYTIFDSENLESDPAIIKVIINESGSHELDGRGAMTPNGDGLNDYLIIGNADAKKTNELFIIDENGNQIYYKKDYKNDWSGTDKDDKKLAPGVYLYIYREFNGTAEERVIHDFLQIVN